MLEPAQLSQLARAVDARVLVALGPADGFEIWDKAQRIAETSETIEHLILVTCLGEAADGVPDFGAALAAQPDALTFRRAIKPDDTAIYLHTGGTTDTPKFTPGSFVTELVACPTYM